MSLERWFRHVFTGRRALVRAFPPRTLAAIEQAVTESEQGHGGEIRFAIEHALDPAEAWAGKTPRTRALEVFAGLGVWDTELNNGVLIYVLLADHDVEIIADRGFNGRVDLAQWDAICNLMEAKFALGEFEAGSVAAVREVGRLIGEHYPFVAGARNELPNRPMTF